VSKDGKELKYLDELKLSNEEDAPMTLAVSRPVRAARLDAARMIPEGARLMGDPRPSN
jgi:hypothetical protein